MEKQALVNIAFTQNWNNKFNCDYFSFITLHNPDQYTIGRKYHIITGGITDISGTITAASRIKLPQITDALAFLDCGQNAAFLKRYLMQLYPNELPDHDLGLYIIRNDDRFWLRGIMGK